eukprot:TRINITY_DN1867_c0_g1_i11.p4 TRINITY_DN1867_c0_g1~~TRINITY_DN1867_c0_g1_i11.p4  ORF type:complete len:376 (-),score=25.87 TRINITY_DN1867_c0_g1_i11:3992-5029(-)
MDENQIQEFVRLVSNKRVLEVAADFLINGQLTKSQFMRTFQAPKHVVDNLFELYDDDGNGVLDHKEFLQAMRDLDSGRAHATCDICKQVMWKWYCCEVCMEDFQICSSCHASEHGHPHKFQFVRNYKDKECGEFPAVTGLFLAKEINSIMQEYDFDSSGTISVEEFLSIVPSSGQNARKVIKKIFGENDGELSSKHFLYVMSIIEASRACSECKQDFELDNCQALCCASRRCEYNICKKCIKSGRCSHTCAYFECAGPFQLRDVGMALSSEGKYKVVDKTEWAKWKPFFDAYLSRNQNSIVFFNPNYSPKVQRVMTIDEGIQLEYKFAKRAVLFDFDKFVSALTS